MSGVVPLGAVLTDEQWPAEIADLLGGFAGDLNVYRVMAHSPALVRAWAPLRRHLVQESALAAEWREIVILRVGHRWGSAYEWGHHVVRARGLGMDPARVERARLEPGAWPAELFDSVLMAAVDTLLDEGRLSPGQIGALADRLPGPAIIEVMALVGMYTTLAFLVRTFDTPLEARIVAELAAVQTE